MGYFISVGSALSQVVNALIGGNPNESLSGRAYRLKDKGWGWLYKTLNTIFFFQEDHCQMAYEKDIEDAGRVLLDSIEEIVDVDETDSLKQEVPVEEKPWAWGDTDYIAWWKTQSHKQLMSQYLNGSNFPVRMTKDEWDHWNSRFIDDINKYVTEWQVNNNGGPPTGNGMGEDGRQK